MKKAMKSGDDMNAALMNVRAVPIDSKLGSPAQLMLGRPMTTMLPHRSEPGPEAEIIQHQKRQETMVQCCTTKQADNYHHSSQDNPCKY